jgi:hypothetical protein
MELHPMTTLSKMLLVIMLALLVVAGVRLLCTSDFIHPMGPLLR